MEVNFQIYHDDAQKCIRKEESLEVNFQIYHDDAQKCIRKEETMEIRDGNRLILEVDHLGVGYGERQVIRDITFSLKKGEILGIVGESGCGKSTLIKSILCQPRMNVRKFSGSLRYQGRDLSGLDREELRKLHGTGIGMIFQNPGASFNPIRTYRSQFLDTLKSHGRYEEKVTENQIRDCLCRVGLEDTEQIMDSCPFELSGGMNQRVAIAMMMMLRPLLLLADEPTSALDVTVQKQVADELLQMRKEQNTAIILVTHNIGLVRYMADRVAILYAGSIVEAGSAKQVLEDAGHPYTKALLRAVPGLHGSLPVGLEGTPPANGAQLEGCPFRERCPEENCPEECGRRRPELKDDGVGHQTACFLKY